MSFLSSLDISGSALTAQRLRLDAISENIANMQTTRTESGDPYRRKTVVFEEINEGSFRAALLRAKGRGSAYGLGPGESGVRVAEVIEDESPFKIVYDPAHPDADEQGYVRMPNVDLLQETIDAMSASRSYEANVTAINAIKQMATKALEVGR